MDKKENNKSLNSDEYLSKKLINQKSSSSKITANILNQVKASILYEGKKGSLFKDNKQVVYVQFADEKATPTVTFNKSILMYYSNELSSKNQVATYIGLFDKGISNAALNDINKYKFNKNVMSENITFGDVNGDNVINAQDVLNTVSVVLNKQDKTKEKNLIAMDNNGDCKIDNIDIIGILDKYTSNKESSILSNLQDLN